MTTGREKQAGVQGKLTFWPSLIVWGMNSKGLRGVDFSDSFDCRKEARQLLQERKEIGTEVLERRGIDLNKCSVILWAIQEGYDMPRTARRFSEDGPKWDLSIPHAKALCMVRRGGAILTPWRLASSDRTFGLDLQEHRNSGMLWLDARSEAGHAVELFAASPARLEMELERMALPPRAVFLSPTSDPFHGPEEAQSDAVLCAEVLARRGITTWIRTRARIACRLRDRLAALGDRVRVTVPLCTREVDLTRQLEPGTASPMSRLKQVDRLKAAGIPTLISLDPLVIGLHDRQERLLPLLRLLVAHGVSQLTAGYLALPEGAQGKVNSLLGVEQGARLAAEYRFGPLTTLASGATARLLPRLTRQRAYARLAGLGAGEGIAIHVCRWANPDFLEKAIQGAAERPRSLRDRWQEALEAAGRN